MTFTFKDTEEKKIIVEALRLAAWRYELDSVTLRGHRRRLLKLSQDLRDIARRMSNTGSTE